MPVDPKRKMIKNGPWITPTRQLLFWSAFLALSDSTALLLGCQFALPLLPLSSCLPQPAVISCLRVCVCVCVCVCVFWRDSTRGTASALKSAQLKPPIHSKASHPGPDPAAPRPASSRNSLRHGMILDLLLHPTFPTPAAFRGLRDLTSSPDTALPSCMLVPAKAPVPAERLR